MPGLGGAWRSLVAHLLWEQGVGGSNPLAPTAKLARPLREPCGCSSTVEPQPSKLVMGVRFPSPALAHPARSKAAAIGPYATSVSALKGFSLPSLLRTSGSVAVPVASRSSTYPCPKG